MGLTTGQNGNLYAVGGDIGGGGDYATTKVNVYSPKTNTWTPIAPLLTPKHSKPSSQAKMVQSTRSADRLAVPSRH